MQKQLTGNRAATYRYAVANLPVTEPHFFGKLTGNRAANLPVTGSSEFASKSSRK